jgi:hypothetical protein
MIDSILDRLTDMACVVVDWLVWLGVWLFWLGVLALALLGATARAAPLPKPRPAPPFAGTYDLEWHGTAYVASFLPDGSYLCFRRGEQAYAGTWRLEGGTLRVEERLIGSGPDVSSYQWESPADGRPGEFPRVRLRRIK